VVGKLVGDLKEAAMGNRDERRRYEADVYYEVWRSGGNPDAIALDRVDVAYDEGRYADDAAHEELRRQRKRARPEEEEPDE
jgi:hypothetical protein